MNNIKYPLRIKILKFVHDLYENFNLEDKRNGLRMVQHIKIAMEDSNRRLIKILNNRQKKNHKINIKPIKIKNINCEVISHSHKKSEDKIILYCHGGGFCRGDLIYARNIAKKLTLKTRITTLTFEYDLSPEAKFPTALNQSLLCYKYLLNKGYKVENIILLGDSAGGNMALSLCHLLKKIGLNMPGKIILFSPWVNMYKKSKYYKIYENLDPILTEKFLDFCKKSYLEKNFKKSKFVSPIYGDFTGFPKVLIQVGEYEILLGDSIQLHKKLIKNNVNSKLEIYNNVWHVFQMFPIKKANKAIINVAKYINNI